MGMFDYIIREPVKCPGCGKELNDFQSKTGFRRLLERTPEQLVEDTYKMWGEGTAPEYHDYCLGEGGCGGGLFFTYDREKKKWKQEFLTDEELYPDL